MDAPPWDEFISFLARLRVCRDFSNWSHCSWGAIHGTIFGFYQMRHSLRRFRIAIALGQRHVHLPSSHTMNVFESINPVPRSTRTRKTLRKYFSLRDGQADDATIDQTLRSGIALRGTNLWILMFAIFIASIGLDVNSTAVIIGAMLISPLMGPIMGFGYGIGIYDFPLIRKSLKNLVIATAISLATSTVYFLCSPLTGAHSELLARTTPNIWDVLIALFGGLAGMVGATRQEKSNVLPGVAIATALMPPLCTAGYGLAHGDWSYFGGAFYLFSINCVFIAFATVVLTWIIKPQRQTVVDERIERRVKRYVLAAVLATAIPSVYLAFKFVDEELFRARAQQFLAQELTLKQTVIAGTVIRPKQHLIDVTLVGQRVDQTQLDEIAKHLQSYGLAGSDLVIRQTGDEKIDASSLKASIVNDLYNQTQREIDSRDKRIDQLQAELQKTDTDHQQLAKVAVELHAQYPRIQRVLFSEATEWDPTAHTTGEKKVTLFDVILTRPLSKGDKAQLNRWLKVRLQSDDVRVIFG
jgi:uncharacterized hydrophobic protein (TIGR00271 family)